MAADHIYWAYVGFVNSTDGKTRPVLLLRENNGYYFVLRITSKYKNRPKFIQNKYVEIKDWKEVGLSKPSWIDTYRAYELPVAETKLEYIGKLTSRDLIELSKHVKL